MASCLDCIHCKIRLFYPDGTARLRCTKGLWGVKSSYRLSANEYRVVTVHIGRWKMAVREIREIAHRKVFDDARWCSEREIDDEDKQ